MAKKERADHLAHMQGLAESREQAKRLIMAGRVHCKTPGASALPELVDKPGRPYPADTLFILTEPERFVGRGAYKLLTALERFDLDVRGFVVLDAGASTGGFVDCLLQHGAARVYAADVGRGQLHERLRADPRVIPLEGVNLRLAPPNLVPEDLDMVTADLSFISLTLALPPCLCRLKPGGLVAALIKPQFEIGPGGTVKGVVRDEALRQAAVEKVLRFAKETLNLVEVGVAPAAVKGPKGNQEYMAVWRKDK
jgi:23S rRNA (cytidine1920-2'-O)/16S rRNA (cytidine1409-2'-O)-methyltransferase